MKTLINIDINYDPYISVWSFRKEALNDETMDKLIQIYDD